MNWVIKLLYRNSRHQKELDATYTIHCFNSRLYILVNESTGRYHYAKRFATPQETTKLIMESMDK